MKTFKIPLKPGNQGAFELTGNFDENLKQQIKVLLSTEQGSRIFEDYGGSVRKFLFEPNDSTLHFKVQSYISDKFKKYIPELKIQNIEVAPEENILYINIFFNLNEKIEKLSLKIQ